MGHNEHVSFAQTVKRSPLGVEGAAMMSASALFRKWGDDQRIRFVQMAGQ
jgi:hypothetical protein